MTWHTIYHKDTERNRYRAAVTRNADLNRAQFQVLAGGNVAVHEGLTIDAGMIVGHSAASPRLGLQIGFSWDVPR